MKYRTPNTPKQRTDKSALARSLSQHPQTAIAHNPNFKRTACSSAYAIALPTSPNSDRSQPPNFKRTACSSAYAIALHIPKQRFLRSASLSHTTLILTDRSPNIPKQRSPTTTLILNDSYGALVPSGTLPRTLSHPISPNSDSCGALRYRSQPPNFK